MVLTTARTCHTQILVPEPFTETVALPTGNININVTLNSGGNTLRGSGSR